MMESHQEKQSFFKRISKSLSNLRCVSISFLLTACLIVILAIFSTVTNTVFNCTNEQSYSSLVFSISLILGCVILAYFCIDAILKENEFQLFMFCAVLLIFSVGIIGYIIKKIFEIDLKGSNIVIFVFILAPCIGIIICDVIFLLLLYPVYRSFGWSLFNLIGTNRILIQLYKSYHIFLTLLKGDLCLLTLIMIVQFSLAPVTFSYDVLPMSPISVAVTIFSAIVAHRGVRKEKIGMMILFFVLTASVAPLYLIYKVVFSIVFFETPKKVYDNPFTKLGWVWIVDFKYTIIVMNILIGLFLIVRVLMLIFGIVVSFNFNKGLKEVFNDQEKQNKEKNIFTRLIQNV